MAYNEDLVVRSSGKIECILCEIFLADETKSILSHINNNIHKEMYLKRMMIRHNIAIKNGNILCLVCKDNINKVSEIKTHIQSSCHVSLFRCITNEVEKDGAFLELPTDITERGSDVHCAICDENVSLNLEEIKSHIGSAKHKRARSIIVQTFNGIFSVEDSDNDLWCKICQVYIQNYVEIILEHVDEDVTHLQKLNNILKLIKGEYITIDKYLTIASEDKALCRKCDIRVPCSEDNIEAHIKGKKHKN